MMDWTRDFWACLLGNHHVDKSQKGFKDIAYEIFFIFCGMVCKILSSCGILEFSLLSPRWLYSGNVGAMINDQLIRW